MLTELWRTRRRPQVLIARDLGISTKHLSMIRQGHAEPSLGLLRQMCSLLTPELLAEVREGRALRERLEGLAEELEGWRNNAVRFAAHAEEDATTGAMARARAMAYGRAIDSVRAALAAVDPS